MVDVIQFALVGLGGIFGAWCRHLLGEQIETKTLDTLAVNVVGSFALGILLTLPETNPLFSLAGVGFCGAFTTFSTFAFESVRLFETGSRQQAVLNAVGNLVGALVAVTAGIGVAAVVV